MTADPPRRSDDDDIEDRLDELEDALAELRDELRGDARPRFRPPTPSELLRFTEEYTIPTVIATLEATIQALKLFQGVLRLADPQRGLDAEASNGRDPLSGPRAEATNQLTRSLSELRRALGSADLPEEEAPRSLIEDARDLSAEIERRLDDATREADEARGQERRDVDATIPHKSKSHIDFDDDAVTIEVTDPDEDESGVSESGSTADKEGSNADEDDPQVDVDAELESIKDEMDADRSTDRAGSNGSDDRDDESIDDNGDAGADIDGDADDAGSGDTDPESDDDRT